MLSGGGHIHSVFDFIISPKNILSAWKKFKKGKMSKMSVQVFSFFLERHILEIVRSLKEKTYIPKPYRAFYVYDPKRRHIHSAEIIDRVVQQAIFQNVEPLFDSYFIYDSYSSRQGTHAGVKRLEYFLRKTSKNYTKTVYVLKCDIQKFFNSIDHAVLKSLLRKKILDADTFVLIEKIIDSFSKTEGKGLPLGNVTSQLFGNTYMHVFDHFVKHDLKIKQYIRYCDDFVIVYTDKAYLESLIPIIESFLYEHLRLILHPKKREIRKVSQGIDFLGYIVFPHYIRVRKTTRKRIQRKYKEGLNDAQKISYDGVLSHASEYQFKKKLQ